MSLKSWKFSKKSCVKKYTFHNGVEYQLENVNIKTIEEIEKFLEGSQKVELEIVSREDKYFFIKKTLLNTTYKKLCKKNKGTVIKYLEKITGYEVRV